MKKYTKIGIVAGIIVVIGIVLSFTPAISTIEVESGNVASKYCLEQGGSSFTMTLQTEEGEINEQGICEFLDGSQCEEWAYYRGECKPAR